MTRLIDADALTMLLHDDIDGLDEEFPNDKQVKPYMCGVKMALSFIDTAPTVDAVPVRHGHWIDEGAYADYTNVHAWRCSECEDHVLNYKCDLSRYCPNCGARMDGESDE